MVIYEKILLENNNEFISVEVNVHQSHFVVRVVSFLHNLGF